MSSSTQSTTIGLFTTYEHEILTRFSTEFAIQLAKESKDELINYKEISTDFGEFKSNEDLNNYKWMFVKKLFELIKRLIESIKDLLNEEKLESIYDLIISLLLNVSHKIKKDPPFTLKAITTFFSIFGLNYIPENTIRKIDGALQWNIISMDWINLDYINYYRNDLSQNTSPKTIECIDSLLLMLKIKQKEKVSKIDFDDSLNKIIHF